MFLFHFLGAFFWKRLSKGSTTESITLGKWGWGEECWWSRAWAFGGYVSPGNSHCLWGKQDLCLCLFFFFDGNQGSCFHSRRCSRRRSCLHIHCCWLNSHTILWQRSNNFCRMLLHPHTKKYIISCLCWNFFFRYAITSSKRELKSCYFNLHLATR